MQDHSVRIYGVARSRRFCRRPKGVPCPLMYVPAFCLAVYNAVNMQVADVLSWVLRLHSMGESVHMCVYVVDCVYGLWNGNPSVVVSLS